jgi:subtilisin family serine protease
LTTEASAPSWGLGRVSHRNAGNSDYIYDSSAGSGVYAYVIDTGIYIDHTEFGGRASWGANFVDSDDTDGHGHGTHVSGTIASSTYGIAKSAHLIAVKVLDASGSGSNSGVIAGIQWAAKDVKSKGRAGKAVANMSLGGSFSSSVNSAVNNAAAAGLFFAVAAGNDNVSSIALLLVFLVC